MYYRRVHEKIIINAFDIEDYVKHLHRMKVRPDTEVDDAFDCGEVGGDTTETAAFGQDV